MSKLLDYLTGIFGVFAGVVLAFYFLYYEIRVTWAVLTWIFG